MLVPEVQNLDIISVNIWQMLVSMINLLLLLLIIKKFLYKPVREALSKRKETIDGQYSDAARAKQNAVSAQRAWEDKLSEAQSDADAIIDEARIAAKRKSDDIISAADAKAKVIVHRAQVDAELEKKKAQASIRGEIVDVSMLLTEKMIGREINETDHRKLIDSFINGIDSADGIGDDDNVNNQ